jgi:hypothetical protein
MQHGSERSNAKVRLLISKNQPKFPMFTKSGQEPVAPHLTVGVTDTIAQSRPTSLVSGGRAFWVASIAQAERDTRATHVHSNTGA